MALLPVSPLIPPYTLQWRVDCSAPDVSRHADSMALQATQWLCGASLLTPQPSTLVLAYPQSAPIVFLWLVKNRRWLPPPSTLPRCGGGGGGGVLTGLHNSSAITDSFGSTAPAELPLPPLPQMAEAVVVTCEVPDDDESGLMQSVRKWQVSVPVARGWGCGGTITRKRDRHCDGRAAHAM